MAVRTFDVEKAINERGAMKRILIATSNPGKMRDFAGAAAAHGIKIVGIPNFSSFPSAAEDGTTFEENARKKAEHYSHLAPGEMVVADDSGLEVDALNGAPGVHSARYANLGAATEGNSNDAANNARLLRDLADLSDVHRSGRFVCVLAVGRDGKTLAAFRGEAEGRILHAPRGTNGFGYDPLFYFSELGKAFGELGAVEKDTVSHRGAALRKFLEWCERL